MIFHFLPLLKSTIWGGQRIAQLKRLEQTDAPIGESWELSAVAGSESVVASGPYKGFTLSRLVNELKEQLVGRRCYERFGTTFPLLVKLIDAKADLSLQVHPDDEAARRHGHEHGKTEMWYVLPSDAGAYLYDGFRQPMSREQLLDRVEHHTVTGALRRFEVGSGDTFFIPAGRVHAVGAGCFVLEIQQTSDVTYRIYDYGRRDAQGRQRQLHLQEAAECMDYGAQTDEPSHAKDCPNEPVGLVSCPYFCTRQIEVRKHAHVDYCPTDSFVILTAVKGDCFISTDDGERCTLRMGETVLLAAKTGCVHIAGNATLIETTLPAS